MSTHTGIHALLKCVTTRAPILQVCRGGHLCPAQGAWGGRGRYEKVCSGFQDSPWRRAEVIQGHAVVIICREERHSLEGEESTYWETWEFKFCILCVNICTPRELVRNTQFRAPSQAPCSRSRVLTECLGNSYGHKVGQTPGFPARVPLYNHQIFFNNHSRWCLI